MERDGVIARTLMCRDHEVARLRYDPARRAVVGAIKVISHDYLPLGCLDSRGSCTKPAVTRWLARRAVPGTRAGMSETLADLGIADPVELMMATMGLSLSDQYWLRPDGFTGSWHDVSCYGRDFSTELGRAIVAHGSSSATPPVSLRRGLKALVGTSSPDAALNGNLPKRWAVIDGTSCLLKRGHREHFLIEPYSEVLAAWVCNALLEACDFVPYRLVTEEGELGAWSCCPNMTDENTEFVPAVDIAASSQWPNHLSRYEAFARTCEAHGLSDARAALSKMLVIDRIIGNTDRHWGNFGVLMDSETRTWKRLAPLFDNGESFRARSVDAAGPVSLHFLHPMPFRVDAASQLESFVEDLSWFDPARMEGFAEQADRVLRLNPFVDKVLPEHVGRVIADVEAAVAAVAATAARRSCLRPSLVRCFR